MSLWVILVDADHLALLLVFFALVPLWRWRPLLLLFYLAQTFYLAGHMAYYFYAQRYVHLSQLFTQGQEGAAAVGALWLSVDWRMLVLLLDLPCLLWWLAQHDSGKRWIASHRRQAWGLVAFAFLTLLGVELQNLYIKRSLVQLARDRYRGETIVVRRYGTLVNSLVDLYHSADQQQLIQTLEYGPLVQRPQAPQQASVLVVQVESLDAYMVGLSYQGQMLMPFLSQLSHESLFYPYMLSYHAGGATSDCEFSVINGIEPFESRAALKLSQYDYPNSFVRRLRQAGYKCEAFHNNHGDYFNRRVSFASMGFGRFWDLHDMGIKPSGWGASDADVRIFLQQTLRKQQGLFYFHWITMTSHGPYTLVRQLYQEPRFAAIEPEAVRDYLTSMAYVDQQLAALVTSFKAQHPDAYLVIYGDHTSSLQHGFTPSTLQHDGHRLEFVPLFIVTPDQQVRRENQRVASFLDLSVSILGAAGVAYSLHSFGCDVLQPLTMEQVRYQGGWLDRRQLYQDMEAKRPHRLEHDH